MDTLDLADAPVGRKRTTKAATAGSYLPHGPKVEQVVVPPLDFGNLEFVLFGTAPFMQCRFSQKAMNAMLATMAAGSTAKKGKAKDPRDFDADYHGAIHYSTDGWIGIPASAFRNAAISACKIVGFQMTRAKLSLFIEADGLDRIDGTPLVRIYGEPERTQMPVRNATGVMDIRIRPMWREWTCRLRVRFDRGQFTATDVANLLTRVGAQVGIGEGRPDSKSSAGLGYGLFELRHPGDFYDPTEASAPADEPAKVAAAPARRGRPPKRQA